MNIKVGATYRPKSIVKLNIRGQIRNDKMNQWIYDQTAPDQTQRSFIVTLAFKLRELGFTKLEGKWVEAERFSDTIPSNPLTQQKPIARLRPQLYGNWIYFNNTHKSIDCIST